MIQNDKTSLNSYLSYKTQKSMISQGSYSKQKQKQIQQQKEHNEQEIISQFQENELRMKKIRQEAKKRKEERLKKEQEQQQREQEEKNKKKDELKKRNMEKIKGIKRQDPKTMKGDLKGLDLDTKNSQLIYNKKKIIPTESDDDIFVKKNRLLESLDLDGSALFVKQMTERKAKNIYEQNTFLTNLTNEKPSGYHQQNNFNQGQNKNQSQNAQKQNIINQQNNQQEYKIKQQQNQFKNNNVNQNKYENKYQQKIQEEQDDIEEIIVNNSFDEENQRQQVSQIQYRNNPIPQKKKSQPKQLPQRVISGGAQKNPQNSQISNATRFLFNEAEFIRADLININKEEYEIQKELFEINNQNQAQLKDIYDRNDIENKYQNSKQVIQNLDCSIAVSKKTGNQEQDLEASLANLDNILERQKVKQYQQNEAIKQIEAQQQQRENEQANQLKIMQLQLQEQQLLIQQQQKIIQEKDLHRQKKNLSPGISIRNNQTQLTNKFYNYNSNFLQQEISIIQKTEEEPSRLLDFDLPSDTRQNRWVHNPVLSDQKLQKTVKELDSQLAEISSQTHIEKDRSKGKPKTNYSKYNKQMSQNSQNNTIREDIPQVQQISFYDNVQDLRSNISQISRYSQQKQQEAIQDKLFAPNKTEIPYSTKDSSQILNNLPAGHSLNIQNIKYGNLHKKVPKEQNKNNKKQSKNPMNKRSQSEKNIDQDIIEVQNQENKLKINNKLKGLLFEVQEDSLEM